MPTGLPKLFQTREDNPDDKGPRRRCGRINKSVCDRYPWYADIPDRAFGIVFDLLFRFVFHPSTSVYDIALESGHSQEIIMGVLWNLHLGGRLKAQRYDSSYWLWKDGDGMYSKERDEEIECACNMRFFNNRTGRYQVDVLAIVERVVAQDKADCVFEPQIDDFDDCDAEEEVTTKGDRYDKLYW